MSVKHDLHQTDGPVQSGSMPDLHMMVDIETMGVSVTAPILTIGACMFNPRDKDTEESLDDTFYIRASLESNMKTGRMPEPDTILWWLNQDKDARMELCQGEQTNLGTALFNFRKWVTSHDPKPTRAWAKAPDFDCSILRDAMESVNEIWPFHFASHRCVRTITDLAYPEGDSPMIGVGVAHNAMDDAKRQALMVQHCYGLLKS